MAFCSALINWAEMYEHVAEPLAERPVFLLCVCTVAFLGGFNSWVAQAGNRDEFSSLVTLSCGIKQGCCLAEGQSSYFWNSWREGDCIKLKGHLKIGGKGVITLSCSLFALTWRCCSHVSIMRLSAAMLVFRWSKFFVRKTGSDSCCPQKLTL